MILEEKEIKYIFNPSVLIPGDILLMNTYEEGFRKKLKCKYEHAAIYIGDAQIMESNGAFVVMSHIYSYAFKGSDHACVLRLKKYSETILSDVARNARKQMGREYIDAKAFRYIRENKTTEKKDESNRSFCSRLVAQSYEEENIKLVPNSDFCEPDDFLNVSDLEPVKDAVVPISKDIIEVVISQQKNREETELYSPNAELYKNLSTLYKIDIQDFGQAIEAALKHPELDKNAINIIVSSEMFKHMDSVKKDCPWFFNDEDFFTHFSVVKNGMHFLYSQMRHYDYTIIPDYKELYVQILVLSFYFPKSDFFSFLKRHLNTMVSEAITCRKRLEYLFIEIFQRHKEDFLDFVNEYGFYAEFEYVDKPLNIGFIIRDLMKATK